MEPAARGALLDPDSPAGLDRERYIWFLRQRWLAIVGILATITLAWSQEWVTTARELYGVVLVMALYNLGFRSALPWFVQAESRKRRQALSFQFLCDLAALTLLIHWSGGVENPFAFFFAFHMALAGMLLRPAQITVVVAVAWVLFGGTLVAEYQGWIQHYPLMTHEDRSLGLILADGGPVNSVVLTGYLIAFGGMLAGVAYFTQSLEKRRRIADVRARSRERIAQSRERLARIGEISSGLVHTIRNPLHGVMNCVDLLRPAPGGDVDPGERAELLDMMREGLGRIEGVTNRLMTMARESELHLVEVDVGELVEEAMRFLKRGPKESGVKVRSAVEGMVCVRLDADKVVEALINLLDNAVGASKPGDEVTVDAWIDGEGNLCIEVSDEGEGIPEENLERIFDPFFTTKPIGEGTGLGLALVRRVTEAHGGMIRVESSPEDGTRIVLVFPSAEFTEGEPVGGIQPVLRSDPLTAQREQTPALEPGP